MFGCVLTLFSILWVVAGALHLQKYNFSDEAVSTYEAEWPQGRKPAVNSQSLGDWSVIKAQLVFTNCREEANATSASFCYRGLLDDIFDGLQKKKTEIAKALEVKCKQGVFVRVKKLAMHGKTYDGALELKSSMKNALFPFNFKISGNETIVKSVVFSLNYLVSEFKISGFLPMKIPFVLRRASHRESELRRDENSSELFDFVFYKSEEFADCKVEMQMMNVDPFGFPEHTDEMFTSALSSMELDEIGISEQIDGLIDKMGDAMHFNESFDISEYMESAESIAFWSLVTPILVMVSSITLTCAFGCLYLYWPQRMKVHKQGPQITKIIYKVAEPTAEQVPAVPKKLSERSKPKMKKKEKKTSEGKDQLSPFEKPRKGNKKKEKLPPQTPSPSDPSLESRPTATDKIEDSTLPINTKTEGQSGGSVEPTAKTTEAAHSTILDVFKESEATTDATTTGNDRITKADSTIQDITINDEKDGQPASSHEKIDEKAQRIDSLVPFIGSSDGNVFPSKTGTNEGSGENH